MGCSSGRCYGSGRACGIGSSNIICHVGVVVFTVVIIIVISNFLTNLDNRVMVFQGINQENIL